MDDAKYSPPGCSADGQKGEPMRLIEADESLKRINDIFPRRTESDYQKGIAVGMSMAKVAINEQPTIDAEPVRRGRWIGGELGKCSVCGHVGYGSDIWHECYDFYCPNCGAKMEVDDE